jgi:hypothetical protein
MAHKRAIGAYANSPFCSVAPRAGLEPATSRLQVPQFFNRAWTISSPACKNMQGRVLGAVEALLGGFRSLWSLHGPAYRLSLRHFSGQALRRTGKLSATAVSSFSVSACCLLIVALIRFIVASPCGSVLPRFARWSVDWLGVLRAAHG